MKKVIGVICFIAAAGVGYAIGLIRGVVETMREHDTNPENFHKMNYEVNNALDALDNLKEDTFKK